MPDTVVRSGRGYTVTMTGNERRLSLLIELDDRPGALEAALGAWRSGLAVRHAVRQDRVPATDTPTAGYTMLDLWAGVALPLPGEASAFVRVNNATDRLGFNAATIGTLRGLAPLPGRALSAGLRWRW